MIKSIATCPYCSAVIAVDVVDQGVVFNPDRARRGPCPHLGCSLMRLCVWGTDTKEGEGTVIRTWLYERGRGLRLSRPDSWEDYHPFAYLLDSGVGDLPAELVPRMPFRLDGGGVGFRERQRPGSGEFEVGLDRRGAVRGDLEGWACVSPSPAKFMRHVRRLQRRHAPQR
jgi:hypothetical protein